jgi:hypothetical protein
MKNTNRTTTADSAAFAAFVARSKQPLTQKLKFGPSSDMVVVINKLKRTFGSRYLHFNPMTGAVRMRAKTGRIDVHFMQNGDTMITDSERPAVGHVLQGGGVVKFVEWFASTIK